MQFVNRIVERTKINIAFYVQHIMHIFFPLLIIMCIFSSHKPLFYSPTPFCSAEKSERNCNNKYLCGDKMRKEIKISLKIEHNLISCNNPDSTKTKFYLCDWY